MSVEEFRKKYKGKGRERYNKCIRAEFPTGNDLMELRRYVSYRRNVKPIWGEPGETHEILTSIIRQTPTTDRFEELIQYVNNCIDSKPMAGGINETRAILGRLETILSKIRDDMISEIAKRYNF